MERRVLIVEPDSDFALSMASMLNGVGYQTAVAEDGSAALRELEKRRHDLVVLRAELPDQSGFVLCSRIKKSESNQGIGILILSSEVDRDGLAQHAGSPNAVEGYLSVPFEMSELVALASRLTPLSEAAPPSVEEQEMDATLDSALSPEGNKPRESPPPAPPPIPLPATGGPPRLPKRERRSAMTEEDRAFLDRTFQSIADRKAELLAESRQLRRTPPRREMMGTPEGKLQILREELKLREGQIARLSEIWSVRERELLSVEDRLHEKDVELQGLKMQVDDLLRRFNDAQQAFVVKEKEHGATVDDLLLQKFATEKDLIEVVASKEKDINTFRREAASRDEELSRRAGELEASRKEHEKLEKQLSVATLEFEVKEQNLTNALQSREGELSSLRAELEKTRTEMSQAIAERDRQIAEREKSLQETSDELLQSRQERDSTVRGLEARLGAAEAHASQSDAEIQRLRADRAEFEKKVSAQAAELEAQVAEMRTQRDELRVQRDALAQSMADRLSERDLKIGQLEAELGDLHQRKERQEAELGAQIQRHLERIGELEGEVEAAQAQLADRESELQAQIADREKHWEGAFGQARAQIDDLTGRKNALGQQLDEARATLAQREQRLEQIRQEMEKERRERALREGELQTARNEIARISGILRQTEEAKAAIEKKLTAELEHARGEAAAWQERFDAERDAHAQTREVSEGTSKELQSAKARQQKLQEEHAAQRKAFEKAHAQLTEQIAALQSQSAESQAYAADLDEQLSNAKQELGARVAEVTQLSVKVSQAEDARQDAEERLVALTEESERREALLQNDVAAKAQGLSDLQRKLAQLTQERGRQVEALSREVSVKAELAKQAEAKLKVAGDESRRKEEELAKKVAALSNELQSVRSSLGEQLQAAKNALSKIVAERDQIRTTLMGQVQQALAKGQELAGALQQSRTDAKRTQEELQLKVSRAEARLGQINQEWQSKAAKAEHEGKEALQQIHARTRRIQELEAALEGAHGAKLRGEKELAARLAAADSKLNEANGRLSALVRERKELEARRLKEVEELNGKHKSELERRDAVKSQEAARLQQSVLEKSKALKVVELELARYKNKAQGSPPPRPRSADAAPNPRLHTMVTTPAAAPVGNGRPAAPQASSRPAPTPPPAPPKAQPNLESTLVLQIDEDAADWNSVIDDLDK